MLEVELYSLKIKDFNSKQQASSDEMKDVFPKIMAIIDTSEM